MINEKNLANPAQITMATDMALKRQAHQVVLFNRLIVDLQYVLTMQSHDDRERIVDHNRNVVSRWQNV
jgi:hypothetical protein